MYPLSRWMIEEHPFEAFDLEHPERLDRLERIPPWARPRRSAARPGRLAALVGRLRGRFRGLVSRGSLGPIPNGCAGDPAGPRW
jgi:hypothetical protein